MENTAAASSGEVTLNVLRDWCGGVSVNVCINNLYCVCV